jgi:DNA-binding GntR family transcriptional regulator
MKTENAPPGSSLQRWRLRDAIEDAIAEGTYLPGERLDEAMLASHYAVSRTPIREALMQLAATGLVVSRPRRGTVVASLTGEQLFEMFEVMAELEGMAGRLSARRWSPEDKETLLVTHEACRKASEAGDADNYYYENEAFHDAIYKASHNAFLYGECSALHRRLKPYRRLQLRVANRVAVSFQEHDAIVGAILARDSPRAQMLLRDHVVIQGDRFADLVASLPQLRHGKESALRKQPRR